MSKVIVIGGGAAGMMAAIAAAQKGHKVILLEKNEKLGKKLFITGKGRCNVTNAADMDVLFQNICTNEKFLYSAFYGFDNTQVCDLLEQAGCPLKTERGDRVFPVSDHSSDVIAALQRELRKYQVDVHLHTEVKKILTKETDGNPVFCGVECADHKKIAADDCIVCTGGCSYASTGSTGDGYRFAEETGHKVTERKPALVPLEIRENWCRELMGLSLKNVEIRMQCGKKTWYEGFGEMLFTHFGVSGPLILSASSFYSKNLSKRKGGDEVKLFLDLKPALTPEQLDKRLLRDFEEAKNKQFKNALDHLFPAKLIPVMIELSDISPEKKVNEISREERKAFGSLIKELPMTVTGTRSFAEAIITQGGISVKDMGVDIAEVTLHVGLGTFRPVKVENVLDHHMHSEFYMVSQEAADKINRAKESGHRVIAVGTTSTRTLEAAADENGRLHETSGWTEIFIYPGYQFKVIDALITNFHLPQSTLVMLVSALAGREHVLHAYEIAVKERYRFFSFGDAMLIK